MSIKLTKFKPLQSELTALKAENERLKELIKTKDDALKIDIIAARDSNTHIKALESQLAEKDLFKERLVKKLNNLEKTTHGRVFTTEVIELINKL